MLIITKTIKGQTVILIEIEHKDSIEEDTDIRGQAQTLHWWDSVNKETIRWVPVGEYPIEGAEQWVFLIEWVG